MKDWTGNGNSIWKTIGSSSHTDKERETDDFYATSPKAIEALLEYAEFKLPFRVWEPSCGTGCLSEALKRRGYEVVSTDLIDRGYGEGGVDFFATEKMPERCNCILTNPPYKFATEYVKHSLKLLPKNGVLALFLKTTFAEGSERYREIFSFTPPSWFCSVRTGYCVPRMLSLTLCRLLVAVLSVMLGGYGARGIRVRQFSTG